MTCSQTTTDPDARPPEEIEMVEIGGVEIPVLAREIAQHWNPAGIGDRWTVIVAIDSFGSLVNGMFHIPDEGDRIECVDAEGREFTATFFGAKIEAGLLDLGFENIDREWSDADLDTEGSDE